MIIIPAVDIMDHRVVQLVGGVPGSERIVMPDPLSVAGSWVAKGARMLHLVDLDGAFGKDDNIPVIKRIVSECGVPVEVGGGIRSEETIRELVDAGAIRVIVGTKAVREPGWLGEMAERFPGKIMLALDTRGDDIVIKGWQESAPVTVDRMFEIIEDMPLAGILNTNVDVEGLGGGIDAGQVRRFVSRCPHPVVASGGVTTLEDAEELDTAGAVGAVVGMALYTGVLRPWAWNTPWTAVGRGHPDQK
ncbi:MAG: 1-(5-phosphoribosyl)-5-[(5-phosphoribosylamino)methylideneamino]imidazole-4-carboxamide isomerase [Thermoplasmatales archaeon]|nr:1-(5-phosphoribosyl)-5-[(5-phosphoribosylamino)methylideneamino]imidazole-4-carboxamide isomerase [Thermoplasmatales archaeon]